MARIIRLQPDGNVAVRLALAPGAPLGDALAAKRSGLATTSSSPGIGAVV